MPDEQAPAVPVVEPPGEVKIDIGGGNTFNKQQIIDMKTAKEGIESTFTAFKQDAGTKLAELDKARTDYTEANRARIESDAARDAALAKNKELSLQLEGYVSPEVYGKMKESNDLMALKGVSDKIDNAVATYGVDKATFTGKSELAVDAYIEGLSKSGKTAPPKSTPAGNFSGESQGQNSEPTTELEINLKQIKDYRENAKK